MIDIKEIFNNENVANAVSLWVDGGGDSADLAGVAEYATECKMSMLSVVPRDVPVIWPWVERLKLKIISRFDVKNAGVETVSQLAIDVKDVFRQGADGAQIILHLADLNKITDSLLFVRDDLFFNKDLSVGLDIFDVWPLDWDSVFDSLKKLHASSLLLILTHDDLEKSDFVGRIYAALNAWDANANMELHVMLGESYGRAEQVYRLVTINRPELLNKLKFFVSY